MTYTQKKDLLLEQIRNGTKMLGRDQVLLADQQVRGQVRNDRLVGTVREVLVEGPSLRNAARWSGRDGGNRIVVFEPKESLAVGQPVKVRIKEAHPQILIGEVVV